MSRPSGPTRAGRAAAGRAQRGRRLGRRRAFEAVFEAEFGQAPAEAILERILAGQEVDAAAAELAREIVAAVVRQRQEIDDRIAQIAPAYPVQALARIDRALLRCAIAEVLHCPATPQRVAIAEWVELARTYSGEPARRLVNGVLGRLADSMVPAPTREPSQQTGAHRPPGGST